MEREAELEQIGDALRSAVAGSGRTVLIEGAAGIGKSSLLGAAAELAEATGMTVLRARGGVLEREFALGVVIQLLAPSIEPLTERERERAFAGAAGLARPLFEEVPDRVAADDRLFARFHGLHWSRGWPSSGRSPCSSTTRTGRTSIRFGSSPTWRRGSRSSRHAQSPRCGRERRRRRRKP
jgi:hypothetical protein